MYYLFESIKLYIYIYILKEESVKSMWFEAKGDTSKVQWGTSPRSLFLKRIQLGKEIMPPLTPISNSVFVSFNVILFIFYFLHGNVLFL